MSRDLTAKATTALMKQETTEVFLLLIEIDHPDLGGQTIRLANSRQDYEIGGETYKGYPLKIALPADTDAGPPRVKQVIDNVHRLLIDAIRNIATPPSESLRVVLAETPTTVEAGPFDFTLRVANYDAFEVAGTLGYEDVMDEPWPGHTQTPGRLPGLFGGVPEGTSWDPGPRDTVKPKAPVRGWERHSPYGRRRHRV